MARKHIPTPKPAAEPSAADDGSVMVPGLHLTIAGRAIVMREYSFFEGLRVAGRAADLIDAMHADVKRDGAWRYDRVRRHFGSHEDVVVEIAAQAADVEPEWVRGLSRDDQEQFFGTWFTVNSSFFVNEVALLRQAERLALPPSAGPTSSSSSPARASETTSSSAASPSAN